MATFGKTVAGVQTVADAVAADYQQCTKYNLPVAGTVTDMRMYLTWNGAAGTQVIRLACWADSSGSPGALKINSNAQTLDQTLVAGFITFTLPSSVALTAGDYWLGFAAGATSFKLFYSRDTVANALKYRNVAYASMPTDPYGTADGSAAAELAIYATYTLPAAAPAPTNPRRTPRRRVMQRM